MTLGGTLRDMLAAPGLRLRLVAGAPEALDREVRWVHSTELRQPGAYLRGGELICTVGVSLTDPSACADFVTSVASARAVGVCFGTGDVHAEIPTALVQACARLDLPLLELPAGAPFLALSEHLADRWVRAGSATSAHGEQLVARLLSALGEGATIAELLATAAAATGGRLQVGPHSPGQVRWTGTGEPPSADLIAQLGRLVDVARHETQVVRRSRLAEVGHLFTLVADGLADARALQPALEECGLGDCPLLVVHAWPLQALDTINQLAARALVGVTAEVVVVVTAADDAVAASVSPEPSGVSAPAPPERLGHALSQARAALARAVRTGVRVRPHDLTTLDSLLETLPDDALVPFVTALVRPLIDADRRHGTSQVETLRVFLANDGSLLRTARQQFVHVNTVRHRLDRVREITGRDPYRFADRVAFAIALWALDNPSGTGLPVRARTRG